MTNETISGLKRVSWLPDRDAVENGTLLAGQEYYDVFITGGEISGVTLTDVDIVSLSTPLAIADGGTGEVTANDALNALLPDQTSNSGKVLQTDGTDASWQTAQSLPTQTGNAGKYLKTDGSNASWNLVDLAAGVTDTLPVANGGTGRTSNTAYAVLCGGTSTTGAVQSIASVGTSGQVLTSNGASQLPTFQTATSKITFLHGGAGSDSSTSAADLDAYALSGLTVADTLMVVTRIYTATQQTTNTVLRNTTDSVSLVSVSANATMNANTARFQVSYIGNTPLALTNVWSAGANGQSTFAFGAESTFSTNWTGSWSLALRRGAVTTGGTFFYDWSIYKIAGQ